MDEERRTNSINDLSVVVGRMDEKVSRLVDDIKEIKEDFGSRLRKVEETHLTIKGAIGVMGAFTALLIGLLKLAGARLFN